MHLLECCNNVLARKGISLEYRSLGVLIIIIIFFVVIDSRACAYVLADAEIKYKKKKIYKKSRIVYLV